jgi:hypothetical protein
MSGARPILFRAAYASKSSVACLGIRIREVDKAYTYDRGELALALAASLKNAGLTPPDVPGVRNRFLASLQKGEVGPLEVISKKGRAQARG